MLCNILLLMHIICCGALLCFTLWHSFTLHATKIYSASTFGNLNLKKMLLKLSLSQWPLQCSFNAGMWLYCRTFQKGYFTFISICNLLYSCHYNSGLMIQVVVTRSAWLLFSAVGFLARTVSLGTEWDHASMLCIQPWTLHYIIYNDISHNSYYTVFKAAKLRVSW